MDSSTELSLYDRPEEWLNKMINRDGCFHDLTTLLDFENGGKVSVSGMREVDYPPMRFHGGGELEVTKSLLLPPDLLDRFSGTLPNRIEHLLCLITPTEIFVLGVTYAMPYQDATSEVLQLLPDPLYRLPTDNYTVTCMESSKCGRIFFGTHEGALFELEYRPIPGWSDNSPLPDDRTGPCSLINHSASALTMLLPSILTSSFRSTDAVSQLVYDPVRQLLYMRTEDSNLSVYTLSEKSAAFGLSSGGLTRQATLSGADLAYTASNMVRSVDKSQFRKIVSIVPLSSGLCYLMAVTQTGIRVYFGENLRILHIRMPPNSPHARSGLGEIKLVAETRGTVVLVSALPSNASVQGTGLPTLSSESNVRGYQNSSFFDTARPSASPTADMAQATAASSYDVPPHVLYTLSPDPYPWTPNLTELCSTAWCCGGAWALAVLPQQNECIGAADPSWSVQTSSKCTATTPRDQPPVVLTQHLDPPYRRLLLISAQRIVHLRLANPLVPLKQALLRELSSNSLNSSLLLNGSPGKSNAGWPESMVSDCLTPAALTTNSSAAADLATLNTRFLSAYLHQYNPDESICAALVIGAAEFTAAGRPTQQLSLTVEQAILFFAAEAAQYWVPAVRRPNAGATSQQLSSTTTTPLSRDVSIPVGLTDKALSSGLFLYNGLSVFLARMGRTFWRSPLFRDASTVVARQRVSKSINTNAAQSHGLRSWMHTFVNVIASASPMRAKQNGTEEHQPIISRLDETEITWLASQLTFLQQFLRRQLTVRGGWLRAAPATTNLPSMGVRSDRITTPGGDQMEFVDSVLLQRLAEELDKLLTVVLEVMGFWRILSEHVVHKVIKFLSPEQRNLILQLPFETFAMGLLECPFFTSSPTVVASKAMPTPTSAATSHHHHVPQGANLGVELITALVNALIEYYLVETSQDLDSGVSLDAISARLQAACPTLFASEDALSAKASECLIQANLLRTRGTWSNSAQPVDAIIMETLTECDRLVAQALELYTEAGAGIDLDGAVHRLEASGAWRAAVDLCLSVANKRDPTSVAVDCLKHGRRPSADTLVIEKVPLDRGTRRHNFTQSELAATEGRYDAYHQLMCCIERVWELAHLPANATNILNSTMGDPTQNNIKQDSQSFTVDLCLSPASARCVLSTLLQDIAQSDDILAHFELFSWLLSHGLADSAVTLNSPHLEAYLRSRLRQSPDDPDLRCLLWRQLERRGARLEAAQVLEHLAVTPCRQLTLEARLDFAARAIVTVKALPTNQQDLDYLHELESRLEVAQLQYQLYTELSQLPIGSPSTSPARRKSPRSSASSEGDVQDALYRLSHGPLLSLSDMFTNYADKYGLHESRLTLLWAGDSQDSPLIKAIWREMLLHVLSSTTAAGSNSEVTDKWSSPSPARIHNSPIRGPNGNQGRSFAESSQKLVELSLIDCLARLGTRFSIDGTLTSQKSQTFFPLPEIVSTVEYYAIQKKLPASWVPTMLRDTRLTCSSSILDAYDTLLHSRDTLWRHPDVRGRLLVAFATVIEDFVSMVSVQLPMRQRMLQIGRMLDRVTSVLVDLTSDAVKPTKDMAATTTANRPQLAVASQQQQVVERLRRAHDQLQRYYR